jgi:hypothetical protein
MAAPYRACAGSARRPLQQLLRLRAIALTAHIPLIVGKRAVTDRAYNQYSVYASSVKQ